MPTSAKNCLKQCIEYDDARESAPGEHVMTAATGLALIFSALGTRYQAVAILKAAAGGALLWRAFSGRDGVRKWVGVEPPMPHTTPTLPVTRRVRPG